MFQSILRQNVGKFKSLTVLSGFLQLESRALATQATTLMAWNANSAVLRHSNVLPGIHRRAIQISTANYCSEPKKKKQKKNPTAVDHVGRLDMRVGKIIGVNKAPDAEALYIVKVDCGEGYAREIVAGLAKFIPTEELTDRLVIVLCNLKASKLRGHLSEGMIMCATATDTIEPLIPPENSVPGDLVHCENYDRTPVETPRSRQKLFDSLADKLNTNAELIACYDGSFLYVPNKGSIRTKSLKNTRIA